jgi:hypothetical protein
MRVGEKLRVEVLARGERRWATNAREFDSPEEATTFARDLYSRWVPVEKLRIVPVSRPKRELYEPGSDDPELLRELVPLFPLGQVVATPGAIEVIERRRLNAGFLLLRHVTGDWGDMDDDDKARNDHAMYGGNRILSAYGQESDPDRLYVITETDRSTTTFLLPSEY